MNQQILDYLRIIGLTECLLGVLLVALLFLVQRLWKRIEGMSVVLLTIISESEMKKKLADLARRADEIMGMKKGGGAE